MLREQLEIRIIGNRHSPPFRASANSKRSFAVAGLFAGIGGIELGFRNAGHTTDLLCEVDPSAAAVLKSHFSGTPLHADVTTLAELPSQVDLVTAGFPCQDLSQAGKTQGMNGVNSSLVSHLFRLLRKRAVETIVLENVPFMLQLGRGQAMSYILGCLEDLGYSWAYRIVDSRAFGLPHRRRRVYLVASLNDDPRNVLFADEAGEPTVNGGDWRNVPCGFYWTEGTRGLGWAVDAIPTLKGGSTVGIPSPPAIVLTNGEVVKPSIQAAERLQGFRRGWTKPAEKAGRASFRWKLLGNAVSVPAAAWLGRRIARPGRPIGTNEAEIPPNTPWPSAAYNVDGFRVAVDVSEWPKQYKKRSLAWYVDREGSEPLSLRATTGFLSRARSDRCNLRFPEGFLETLDDHVERLQGK